MPWEEATAPSTCDFDLGYKDYSWADWLVERGYVVWMGDYRNYGYSTREKGMDEPAAKNQPATRSYQALRDIEAMVNHIKRTRGVQKVTLIGWSWGAMMAGYYASLYSENVHKLVLYAPLYNFNDHTNLGPGSALQNKRKPYEFNFALGAYRLASEAANTGRWNGEIPLESKDEYRDAAVPAGASAWLPIPAATRVIPRACGLRMGCWRTRFIRPPAGRCGTPRAFTSPPWSSPVPMIPGPIRRIAKDSCAISCMRRSNAAS